MSLLKPRFDYVSIKRSSVEGKRLYLTPDGTPVPSVTTVLSATTPKKKKEALHKWRDRVGHERAQKITTEAANRGTRMHTYLENYIKDGALKDRGSNPFSWPSHLMAELVIKEGLSKVDEVWGVEIPLYFPGLYAGTTDGVGVHQGDEAILDYKQSNRVKTLEHVEDYYLQLTAYALAHNEVHGTNIRKGVVLMAVKPEMDNDGLILGEAKYQEFILHPNDFNMWADRWWKRLEEYYLINTDITKETASGHNANFTDN